MEHQSNSNSGGIGFLGALTIVFITLKLTGIVNWSWWWVLAAVWIPVVLFLLGLILYVGWVMVRGDR